MADKMKALAEYGHNPKYDDGAAEGSANAALVQRAPASAGEREQRRANKAKHSQRVFHGGGQASGAKER